MLASVPRNHPNQTRKRGVLDSVDDRETPDDIFVPLNEEFHFTLDVAAAQHNAKCKRYYARGPQPANDNGGRQLTLFPEVFTGDPDALGYDGWVGCEYHPRASTDDGLRWMHALRAAPHRGWKG